MATHEQLNIYELCGLHPDESERFNTLISRLIANHLIGSTLVEGSTFTEKEAVALTAFFEEHLERC